MIEHIQAREAWVVMPVPNSHGPTRVVYGASPSEAARRYLGVYGDELEGYVQELRTYPWDDTERFELKKTYTYALKLA